MQYALGIYYLTHFSGVKAFMITLKVSPHLNSYLLQIPT